MEEKTKLEKTVLQLKWEVKKLEIKKNALKELLRKRSTSPELSNDKIGIFSQKKSNFTEKAEDICEYYENIIALMPGYIYWLDRNNVYLGCNDAHAKFAGVSTRKDIIGKTNHDLAWKDTADKLDAINTKVMETAKDYIIEETGKTGPGEERTVLTQKTPLFNKYKKVIGILGISLDITDRKKAEAKVIQFEKERNAAMEAKLQAIKTISTSMAHELRTPLRTIASSAASLKKYLPVFFTAYEKALEAKLDVPSLPPRLYQILQGALENIDSETNDAFTVINMLMVAAGMGQAMVDHEPTQTCSAAKCVASALQRYPYDLGEKELVHLQIDKSSPKDFAFTGKELLVVHIFFNLLKNAFYHIKKADKGEIFIWFENDGKNNIIHFKDTGSGIPEEVLAHIFDQFYSNTLHGTGIGLTFCKMAMQNLDGDITCISREREFTEFTLSFPRM